MGKFAETLNLGKRVVTPPPDIYRGGAIGDREAKAPLKISKKGKM